MRDDIGAVRPYLSIERLT